MIKSFVAPRASRSLLSVALVASGLSLLASPAAATEAPFADYRFQSSYASARAGAPDIVPLDHELNTFPTETVDTEDRTVLDFPAGNGLSATPAGDAVTDGSYSIVLHFRLDEVGGYRKLADFEQAAEDTGLYVSNGALHFYGADYEIGEETIMQPNTYHQVVLTRAEDGTVSGYVDGIQQFSFDDSTIPLGVPTEAGELRFFRDDNVTSGTEVSAGAVSRIRLFDGALDAPTVAALDRVPAPDADGDGVSTEDDLDDNNPCVPNAGGIPDADGDSVRDDCDSDDADGPTGDLDGDGVDNVDDLYPEDPSEWADTDSDGIGDNADNCATVSNGMQEDVDGDEIGDVCEPGPHDRTIKLASPSKATGSVSVSDGFPQCHSSVAVKIQRKTPVRNKKGKIIGYKWAKVASATTDDLGAFDAANQTKAGKYRAVAVRKVITVNDATHTCNPATSAVKTLKKK